MVNMLVKCEAKSNRVKGLAFHPTMPWILSALHSGTIQLWDYQLGALLDKFEEHEGPVRGMSFHLNQPLFVSGGDDYKVKVWNYKLKRCLFTLLGHLDYIRTTVFHHEYPWILSASDDQTIRIWNWQSRQCIAVLTGHNHYVMSAAFHPKEDLVISASLDQSIRVWDVSGLKEKTVSSSNRPPSSSMSGNADLFGVNDAVVKFVLEGHDRGVNWAEFHHSQSLIVSASDDRSVKLWRYNESKAWEIDTLRGHFNNVSAVTFHPKQDLIISNGEDKTIRVWDANKRQLLHTFKRENDRFWVLSCHRNSNLIAAGHDSGMVVFKLDRERPMCTGSGPVYVIKDRILFADSSAVGACRKQVSAMASGFKNIMLNPFNSTEMNLIVTYDSIDSYDLFVAPNQAVLKPSETPCVTAKQGSGQAIVFIARNRFAVLSKEKNALNIYSIHNELTKKIDLPLGSGQSCENIFAGGATNRVLLRTEDKVKLLDVSSREIVSELALTGSLRQVVWSASGGQYVALLLKHTVLIADANLSFIQSVNETIRVKSGVWDDDVFVYTTSSHVKYALPYPEENGVIQTLTKPVYLVRAGGGSMTFVDREYNVVRTKLFSHEYLFKQALLQGKSDEVLHQLKAGRLLGSVTIGYLKKKGFPEVALHFVQDKETRFNLSLEFGHLTEAFEAAKDLKRPQVWERLHTEAVRLGNVEIAEKSAIAKHDVEALQFLYLITGNDAKLSKLALKVTKDNDHMARFNLALLRGDIDERVKILEELGLGHLAEKTRMCSLKRNPPRITSSQSESSNWPMTVSMEDIFAAQWAGLEAAAKAAAAHPLPAIRTPDLEEDEIIQKEEYAPIDAKAWGDADLDAELESVQLPVTVAVGEAVAESTVLAYGESQERQWMGKRRMVADLVAAGEFAEALAMLQKKIALVNPIPLQALFMDALFASHASLPGLPFTPSVSVPIMNVNEEGGRGGPAILFSTNFLKNKLKEALQQTGVGNSVEALAAAREVLHGLVLAVAASKEEESELEALMVTAQRYAHAMHMESFRRSLAQDPAQKARELELAAYLSCSRGLELTHLLLVIGSAMNVAFRAKNFVLSAHLAKRIITGAWNGAEDDLVNSTTLRARKVLAASEEKGSDEYKIFFDPNWLLGGSESSFKLCWGNLSPIHPSLHEQIINCPLCKSSFHPEWQGRVCSICQLSAVGANALGIQFMPL